MYTSAPSAISLRGSLRILAPRKSAVAIDECRVRSDDCWTRRLAAPRPSTPPLLRRLRAGPPSYLVNVHQFPILLRSDGSVLKDVDRGALPKLGRLLPYLSETLGGVADVDVQRPEPGFDGFYVWQSYDMLCMQAKQGYKSKQHSSKVSPAKRKKHRLDYSKQARTKRTDEQKAADAARQGRNYHRRMANEPADIREARLKKQLKYAPAYQVSRRDDPEFKRRKSENGRRYSKKNGEELRARKRELAAARADDTNRRG
ncbi:hypothetical protein PaG_05291 [Moesziomyces aphidis]|uniref:Uncharacterized protein n=1 Tax=Moesziomyces aphidis TaxID=84754 RepID=W3VI82_MOEAP|nr:hypothetical protein PaG_05291 [Moesziomyces aphidis]